MRFRLDLERGDVRQQAPVCWCALERLVKLLLLELFEELFIEVVVGLPDCDLVEFLHGKVLFIEVCASLLPEFLEELVVVEDLWVLSHPHHIIMVKFSLYFLAIFLLD